MLIGYFMPVLLIFAISVFAIFKFGELNKINEVIVRTDIPLADTADEMIDVLISQELYARRYAILKSPRMLEISNEKGRKFDSLIAKIRSLLGTENVPLDRLAGLHYQFNALLSEWSAFTGASSPAAKKLDTEIKIKQKELLSVMKSILTEAHRSQNENSEMISHTGFASVNVMLILAAAAIVLSIASTILVTKSIAGPLYKLKLATQKISDGRFEFINGIKSGDEIGDLAICFNQMTARLRQLERQYLDASPLTRLPGNIVIEAVLNKKIKERTPLAFCHIDLDNFKMFNDRYGYARGSKVIFAAARIIEKCVRLSGNPDDFVGHIGGDDFVVITTPGHYEEICKSIIESFDRTIRPYYDPEDLKQGFIISRTRQGDETRIPIMSISIAVVTNVKSRITSSIQVGEIAAELKEYAKSIPGSVYVVDRRREDPGQDQNPDAPAQQSECRI